MDGSAYRLGLSSMVLLEMDGGQTPVLPEYVK
jgi:hypothetical protein